MSTDDHGRRIHIVEIMVVPRTHCSDPEKMSLRARGPNGVLYEMGLPLLARERDTLPKIILDRGWISLHQGWVPITEDGEVIHDYHIDVPEDPRTLAKKAEALTWEEAGGPPKDVEEAMEFVRRSWGMHVGPVSQEMVAGYKMLTHVLEEMLSQRQG